jgi:hypothetical protein
MKNKLYQKIIENYINAYNNFDVDNMLFDMHNNVRFENISNGKIDLITKDVTELKRQAEQAKQFFKEREQKIIGIKFDDDLVEIDIHFKAILAIDFPNGLKAGDKIELNGKSIFKFINNKIIELKDIS